MLQEAEATLDGVLTAHNTHDAGRFAACFAHDGVLRIVPTGDAVHGREQIQVFLEAEFQAFPDWQVEGRGVYDCAAGTWVVDDHRHAGRGVHGTSSDAPRI